MPKIKLIATDMDGTLLNDEKKITAENAVAIKLAQEHGIKFVLASGRMFEASKPYADALGLDTPIISYNGSLVKDSRTEETFFELFMDVDVAFAVLQYCRKINLHVQAYRNGNVYTDYLDASSIWYSKIINRPVIPLGEKLFEEKHQFYKLMGITDPENGRDIALDILQHFTGQIEITSSAPGFVEIVTPGINKWSAVKRLAQMWHIQPNEIMCIGDSYNDLSMIENASIGVAVANANEKVKAHAKFVVADNNHSGVAEAIKIALDRE